MKLPGDVLETLSRNAAAADADPGWPAESWNALVGAGVQRWAIPAELGGLGLAATDLLDGYAALAGACLTTTFVLSQRDAAVRRLRDNPTPMGKAILASLAAGKCFATVGLSQLTTSRQHGKPALTMKLESGGIVLDGVIPWVSGAEHADFFVVGGVLEDSRQVLTLLPRESPGLTIGQPFELAALQGSMTAELHCRQVRVETNYLLAGPLEKVIIAGKGGTGSVETSCLAIGLAKAAIEYLKQESANRPDLTVGASRLDQARLKLRAEMHELVEKSAPPEAAIALRARANSFVLHATQAALIASKGAGFLKDHPAQRWARQALFFLVWSCPRPAADAMLTSLTNGESCS